MKFSHHRKEILHSIPNIDNGIGMPNWNLVGCLIISWAVIFFIIFKGVKSSGKASYVTGITPFIFLVIFLIRAVTLPGAIDGISYFFKPQWDKILEVKVWFNACVQVFFTLNVFFVNVIMYASYNKFGHNIHRDSNIVTTIDTFASIMVGSITFGIIGHLSYELDQPIKDVLKAGPGLVFVTYPETISKFKAFPQFFAVAFFLMLYILALGSILATTSSAITVIRDQFKAVKDWQAALGFAIYGTIVGSLYTTPVS
jgi:solute carrier family 6 amino acid transporter-like protein 5/7/9/14